MNIRECINCDHLSCTDININGFIVPNRNINVENIKILMISEVPPDNKKDYFYSSDESDYMKTTKEVFEDVGIKVNTLNELIDLGVYLTTAVKCSKCQYNISAKTIKKCSEILEKEIDCFPNIEVFLLMGDVAIKAMNYIFKRKSGKKVIPNGSTYRIRNNDYFYEEKKVIPSYLQTGKNYLIEKSKRKIIAEDIRKAFDFVKR